MISYQDILTIDIEKLATAATKWEEMAGKFKDRGSEHKGEVQDLVGDGAWVGQSADVGLVSISQTQQEFASAQGEARAIASVLRSAHKDFKRLIGELKKTVGEAQKAGMVVDSQGRVQYDRSKLGSGATMDLIHNPAILSAEESWASAITAVVTAVNDCDYGVKLALQKAAGVSFFNGLISDPTGVHFNAAADGDRRRVESKAAIDLADRLDKGTLTPEELEDFQHLLRDNYKDKAFSQSFLDALGPERTLHLSDRLNELAEKAKGSDKGAYLGIETDIATTLATATQSSDTAFYKRWRDGLRKTGTEVTDPSSKVPVLGYQSLVTLMSHGGNYSPQFVSDLGDDMIAAEKRDKHVWGMPKGKAFGNPPQWVTKDPIDGLLDIASRDPKTAEAFLDPGRNGENHRLEYLLRDRDWKLRFEPSGHNTHPDLDQTKWVEDSDTRKGLAKAIEAASTGHEPGFPSGLGARHTEGQARVMQDALETLNKTYGKEMPVSLRAPIARTISDYSTDLHEILTGQNPAYGYDGGKDGVWSDKNGDSHIAVKQESLVRVIRAVADDPQSFALIYNTERASSADALARMPDRPLHGDADWTVPSRDTGMNFGILNAVGSDVIMDQRDAKQKWADDVARYGYHLGGAPMSAFVPGVGDAAQRVLDAALYDWSNDVKNLAAEDARGKISEAWTEDSHSVQDLIDSSAKQRHIDPANRMDPEYNSIKQMRQEAVQSYVAGRTRALGYLR
ncbi:hypothetical protein [Streptomyces orinoci]|uniref:Uncharacterized protein n=1 Tax=Streptomyces orinoci TaxID=67339 RepID=A0ABV3KB81_STRON|nr:hypothetical protein [Streptomyces orinoci]